MKVDDHSSFACTASAIYCTHMFCTEVLGLFNFMDHRYIPYRSIFFKIYADIQNPFELVFDSYLRILSPYVPSGPHLGIQPLVAPRGPPRTRANLHVSMVSCSLCIAHFLANAFARILKSPHSAHGVLKTISATLIQVSKYSKQCKSAPGGHGK